MGRTFCRTALESAAYGCATITSDRGGLPETFDNNLIIKKLTVKNLYKIISNLINNNNKLKKVQKTNFENVVHKLMIKLN